MEKRKFGKISYPQDQLDKVKQVIAARLTGATSVAEYFRIWMEDRIRTDWLRYQAQQYDIEMVQRERREIEE